MNGFSFLKVWSMGFHAFVIEGNSKQNEKKKKEEKIFAIFFSIFMSKYLFWKQNIKLIHFQLKMFTHIVYK